MYLPEIKDWISQSTLSEENTIYGGKRHILFTYLGNLYSHGKNSLHIYNPMSQSWQKSFSQLNKYVSKNIYAINTVYL